MPIVRVPLTQGKVATIDAADADLVLRYRWYAVKQHRCWYAYTNAEDGTSLSMHRLLMGRPPGDVDHRDNDGLNNRRSNLRVASRRGLNIANARFEHAASGFRGVKFHPDTPDRRRSKPWQARIKVFGRDISCGYYATAEEAAAAYDRAAEEHFGEFARPNFPKAA